MYRWLFTFFFLFSFLSVTLCHAEEQQAVELQEILVEGAEVPQSSQDKTSASTVIPVPQQSTGTPDIPTLLQSSPGLNITRYGSRDDFAAVSLRGSSHGEVNFYLNSIPLSGASSGFNAWDLFPASFLKNIEIYRGANPGKLVDSSAGGSVLLSTKTIPEQAGFSTQAAYGSFQNLHAGIGFVGPKNVRPESKVGFRIFADHERSKGNFSFLDSNGTYANDADDQVIERINNEFATSRFAGELGFRFKKSELALHNFFLHKHEGIPGFASPQARASNLRTLRNFFTAEHKVQQLAKNLSLDSAAFLDWQWQNFSDPLSEIGLGDQDTSDHLWRVGLQSSASWKINQNNILTPFLAYRSEIFLSEDKNSPGSAATSSRHKLSTGAESEHYFLHDRILLNPSARAEFLLNNFSLNEAGSQQYNLGSKRTKALQFSGKIGVIGKLTPDLSLQSNFGSGFRPPTFSELFGDRGTLVGNPELISEHSIDSDLGLVLDKQFSGPLTRMHSEAFVFYHWINHVIQFLQTSQLTAQAQNLSKAHVYGLESALGLTFWQNLTVNLAYTYQQAKDISGNAATDGLQLPGRPQHIADLNTRYEHKWHKNFASQINNQAHFTSGNFLDTQNFLLADSRLTWDAGLGCTFWQHTQLEFLVKNILNNRVSDLVGYPLPGRSISMGVRYEI